MKIISERNEVLKKFTVGDLDNPVTLKSIQEKLEDEDFDENFFVKWISCGYQTLSVLKKIGSVLSQVATKSQTPFRA